MPTKIDPELLKAIRDSPYHKIAYEYLLEHDPAKIRAEELNLTLSENTLVIPEQLSVENIEVPSSHGEKTIRLRIYKPIK